MATVTPGPVADVDPAAAAARDAALATWVAEVRLDELPEPATKLSIDGIRDCIGVLVAGADTEQTRRVLAVAELLGGEPQAAVLGTGARTNVTQAALVNGTAAHALDFDDTNHPLFGHASCHLVPALLTLGEWTDASGREVLEAYLVGIELEVRVARAINIAHYRSGWHATATLGTLGAAAAAARLLKLPAAVTAHALGIAASLAGGLRQNFGTDTKPLHAGLAAERGVQAALLARAGTTASASAISGRYGFVHVLRGDEDPRLDELDPARFGDPWEITEPYGQAIKQFPSCGATHPAIEASLEAAGRRLTVDEIARVRVGMTEMAPKVLVYHRPETGLQGKFSLEYTVAVALLDGRVELAHFEDDGVARADVQALLPKIEPFVDERIREHPEYSGTVELELADGMRTETRVDVARGKVVRPLSHEQLVAKYEACAGRVLGPAQVARSLALIERLAELRSVRELVAALVPDGERVP